ncbi:MAG: hypothetical protein ACTSVL_03910 [Promethearchaeota archaeon]
MKISEIENRNQLIKSFIVGVLWTAWISFPFFHTRFINFLSRNSISLANQGWIPHSILSVFTLYSILYLPQNCHSNKRSLIYLLKICILHFINVLLIIMLSTAVENIPTSIIFLFLNLIIVWKAKYAQLKFWEKFKSTITLSVKNQFRIKENKIGLLIFVFLGVILLNLSAFYFTLDFIYIIFTLTQIVFSVGYWLHVSENRKWMDRFYDFLVLLVLNVLNLLLKYLVWFYLKEYIDQDGASVVLAVVLELFQVYIYYSFSSRTYLADFAINLHKIPDHFKESSRRPTENEQIYCPKCGTMIEQLDSSINNGNSTIFCPFCGEKIMRYDLLDISEAELLIKHQKVLQQLDHKGEPRSHLP